LEETPLNSITLAIRELTARREAIAAAITTLEGLETGTHRAVPGPKTRKKRTMSKGGRERIREAQLKRWAEFHKRKKAASQAKS